MKNSVSEQNRRIRIWEAHPITDPEVSGFGKEVGLMHELILTGRRVGMTNQLWSAAAHNATKMQHVCDYLAGKAEIVYPDHLINCDAAPFIPDGWSVEKHQKGGQWKWDPKKVSLYLNDGQKDNKSISVHDLRKILAGKPVLNANVLDYLLTHQYLIPKEWKGKAVFFWGTIYRDGDGRLYVRYLFWCDDRWLWDCYWLDGGWRAHGPAVLRAA